MSRHKVYRVAERFAGGCESLEELREIVELNEANHDACTRSEFEYWTERAWVESRAQSPEKRIRVALVELEGGKLDLPGLIRKYDRAIVAAAAGMSVSLLGKLRTANAADPRRLNEDHLIGWLELDAAFSPKLELLRRGAAREGV